MRIDAIVQAVNYSDFLAITLPLNLKHFDSITVYTTAKDFATKDVCRKYGVQYVETDSFYESGAKFCRGCCFNLAFRQLYQDHTDFWSILDADIVLPSNFRSECELFCQDREFMYGARRFNVETEEDWEKVKKDANYLENLTLWRGYGYSYLQLFSPNSSTFRRLWHQTRGHPYFRHVDGSEADWRFRNEFGSYEWTPRPSPPDFAIDHSIKGLVDPPTGLLKQLPFNCIHLGTAGVNATGRHTKIWNV